MWLSSRKWDEGYSCNGFADRHFHKINWKVRKTFGKLEHTIPVTSCLAHSWMCRKQKNRCFQIDFGWEIPVILCFRHFIFYFPHWYNAPDMMCCCCLVSTIWLFFICLRAKLLCLLSPAIMTSSTRPKPPTPSVAMMRRSDNLRLLNSSWILEMERMMILLFIMTILSQLTLSSAQGDRCISSWCHQG